MEKKATDLIIKIIPLFIVKGFKRVNMDDIATSLRISKKTLYKYFNNKKDLIHKAISFHLASEESHSCQLFEQVYNPIEQLLYVADHVQKMMAEMNPSLMLELEKYYPESHKLWDNFMNSHIQDMISQNIEKGKTMGLYRSEIHTELITNMYVTNKMTIIHNENFLEEVKTKDLIKQAIDYHIRGIATSKGLELLEKLKMDQDHIQIEEILKTN